MSVPFVGALRTLWREGDRWVRAALVTFGASIAINLAAVAGLAYDDINPYAFGIPHLAVMGLGFALMARGGNRKYREFRRRLAFSGRIRSDHPIPIPWKLVLLNFLLVLYMLGWMLYTILHYGEGGAELRDGGYAWVEGGEVVRTLTRAEYRRGQADFVAVFSAAWSALALGIALGFDRVGKRLRWLHSGAGDVASRSALTPGTPDAIVPACPPQTSPASSTSSAPRKR